MTYNMSVVILSWWWEFNALILITRVYVLLFWATNVLKSKIDFVLIWVILVKPLNWKLCLEFGRGILKGIGKRLYLDRAHFYRSPSPFWPGRRPSSAASRWGGIDDRGFSKLWCEICDSIWANFGFWYYHKFHVWLLNFKIYE